MTFIRHESGSGIAGTTIELVPKGFNKAVGISAVCRLFDVPWEDTIVFGDSNNDLAMFEYAAVKVAMGNGSEKIKLWLIILHRICSIMESETDWNI